MRTNRSGYLVMQRMQAAKGSNASKGGSEILKCIESGSLPDEDSGHPCGNPRPFAATWFGQAVAILLFSVHIIILS